MASEKATAIVLRVVDFSETSCVVTLFSREYGKLGALAKGARRLKGPFDSALDLLSVCRIVFLRKSSGALDLLTEAKLLRRFRMSARDIERLYAAYYIAELLGELTHEHDPHPELFDLTDVTLERLAGETPVTPIVLRFELLALRYLGHLPTFDRCAGCAANIEPQRRLSFGQLAGGVLCSRCRPGQRQVVSVSAGAIEEMSIFANPTNENWLALESDRKIRGEARGLLNHYISNLLGRRPRMYDYLGFLTK